MAEFSDFEKLDVRVGKIVNVEDFPEAKNPSYKLEIDFGDEVGIKKSSAQLVDNYEKDKLNGKKVLGVVNFAPRQIGSFMSEVLILGVPDENNKCVLIKTDMEVPVGARLY